MSETTVGQSERSMLEEGFDLPTAIRWAMGAQHEIERLTGELARTQAELTRTAEWAKGMEARLMQPPTLRGLAGQGLQLAQHYMPLRQNRRDPTNPPSSATSVAEGTQKGNADDDIYTSLLARTTTFWNAGQHGQRVGRDRWESHPVSHEWLGTRRGAEHMAERVKARGLLTMPVKRGVGIGVGDAHFELQFLRAGVCEHFDVYDIAEESLATGQKLAAQLGLADRITFHQADLNTLTLSANHYDMATASDVLHHVFDLKRSYSVLADALVPGGLLCTREYIGPDRFEFPAAHVEMARTLFDGIPPELRATDTLALPQLWQVIAADPTEAVHAEQVVPRLEELFTIVDRFDYNVALLFILWPNLNLDALYDTKPGMQTVRLLLAAEDALIRSGVLTSYWTEIVARKRD